MTLDGIVDANLVHDDGDTSPERGEDLLNMNLVQPLALIPPLRRDPTARRAADASVKYLGRGRIRQAYRQTLSQCLKAQVGSSPRIILAADVNSSSALTHAN